MIEKLDAYFRRAELGVTMDPRNISEFWQKVAQDSQQQAMQWWQSALGGSPQESQLFAPWQALAQMLQQCSGQIVKAWSDDISQEQRQHWEQKTFNLFSDLEQKTIARLQKMAATNFMQSFQDLLQQSSQWTKDAQERDPQQIIEFWQSVFSEYLKDIQMIPRKVKKIDFTHVAEIWNKMLQGQKDQQTELYSQRLWQSMFTKFKYGPEYYADPEQIEVGRLSKTVVWQRDKIKLYHYQSHAETKRAVPILIVYSLINKPYIHDLLPGYSLIEHFLEDGFDVYLIDWGNPDYEDRNITLDELIDPGISDIVDFICQKNNAPRVSLLGHCLGGVLALLYAALHPGKVDRLLSLTTPITGRDGGVVSLWANTFPIEQILEIFGNMPAKLIRYSFISLKPYYEIIRWYKFYESLDKFDAQSLELFQAVDKWINDNVDVPGAAFHKFIYEVYRDDRFKNGETQINGQKINLRQVTCPLLNIAAQEDWVVTPNSAIILNELVGSEDKTLLLIPGQHVSIMVDPRNRSYWDDMSSFFAKADKAIEGE